MATKKTPDQRLAGTATEWISLMTELAALDRAKYRELRADAWKRVVASHERQSADERRVWLSTAS